MALKYIVPKPGALKYIVLKLGALKYIVLKPSLVPPSRNEVLCARKRIQSWFFWGSAGRGGGSRALSTMYLRAPGLSTMCLNASRRLESWLSSRAFADLAADDLRLSRAGP